MALRIRFHAVLLVTLVLISLCGLGPACDTSPGATGPDAQAAPWCAVETGVPGNRGANGQLVLHTRRAQNLDVSRQPLDAMRLEYHDEFSKDAPDDPGPAAFASHLPDDTWLILLSGPGPWYETTNSLLQLEETGGAIRLRSVHLAWRADVPPIHAWAAIDGGWVHVDDRELSQARQVRLDYRLEGVLLGSDGLPSAKPWRVWSSGRLVLKLQEGELPPVPDEMRAWFEGLTPPG